MMTERYKAIKCMDYLARSINNEMFLDEWLSLGVADGDLRYYGPLDPDEDEIANMEFYADDKEFAELMGIFLEVMAQAFGDGGIYCDGVASK